MSPSLPGEHSNLLVEWPSFATGAWTDRV